MKIRRLLVIALSILSALFSLITANAVLADNLPITPAVTKCAITPFDIPASGGQVTVSIHVVSLNGVYSGITAVTDNVNKSGEHLFVGSLVRVNGTPQDGDWQASFQISNSHTPGNYRLSLYPIADVQGINDGYIHCDTQIVNYGVPPLGISGTTTSIPAPTVTVTASPSPAPTVTVTASPSPAPTVTVTTSPSPAQTVYITNPTDKNLSDLVVSLKSQVGLLNAKLKKICSIKPKIKGC